MKRDAVQKGVEPDECYYVQSFPRIADKKKLDLTTDPPPDLAVEVEIAWSSLPKQPIYAALGVPEIWRFDGKRIAILLRGADGLYAESGRGNCFPHLSVDDVNRFIQIGLASKQPAAVRALREWLKERPTR